MLLSWKKNHPLPITIQASPSSSQADTMTLSPTTAKQSNTINKTVNQFYLTIGDQLITTRKSSMKLKKTLMRPLASIHKTQQSTSTGVTPTLTGSLHSRKQRRHTVTMSMQSHQHQIIPRFGILKVWLIRAKLSIPRKIPAIKTLRILNMLLNVSKKHSSSKKTL